MLFLWPTHVSPICTVSSLLLVCMGLPCMERRVWDVLGWRMGPFLVWRSLPNSVPERFLVEKPGTSPSMVIELDKIGTPVSSGPITLRNGI